MNRRLVVSAMALAVSMLGTQAVYAAPAHVGSPLHAFVGAKVKLVKFSVRNDSGAPMKLKAGENEVAIEAGKTADMKLAEGTQIVTVEASNHEAGSVIATVSSSLAGNTLVLR